MADEGEEVIGSTFDRPLDDDERLRAEGVITIINALVQWDPVGRSFQWRGGPGEGLDPMIFLMLMNRAVEAPTADPWEEGNRRPPLHPVVQQMVVAAGIATGSGAT